MIGLLKIQCYIDKIYGEIIMSKTDVT